MYYRKLGEVEKFTGYGGKAEGLSEIVRTGLPTPPGIVFHDKHFRMINWEQQIDPPLADGLHYLTECADHMGRLPVVSVRSGGKVSMPGMMETILNVGVWNHLDSYISLYGSEFAFHSLWRFFEQVGEAKSSIFRDLSFYRSLEQFKSEHSDEPCNDRMDRLKAIGEKHIGYKLVSEFRSVHYATTLVAESWNLRRAQEFRKHNDIRDRHCSGTDVIIQLMVYGNAPGKSGTGVAFSRNLQTGAHELTGEFLPHRQGEDLVSGSATPNQLSHLQSFDSKAYNLLREGVMALERKMSAPVEVEYTIENGDLYFLQVRPAKVQPRPFAVMLVDMVEKDVISQTHALRLADNSIEPDNLVQEFVPEALRDAQNQERLLYRGIAASHGVVSGVVATNDAEIDRIKEEEKVVLVRPTTTPDDFSEMLRADGILTGSGGASCHAAVTARSLNTPAIVGVDGLFDDEQNLIGINPGDTISLDAHSGMVYRGEVHIQDAALTEKVEKLRQWMRASRSKPHIDISRLHEDRTYDVCELLANFYLSEILSFSLKTKRAEDKFQELSEDIATTFATYLLAAIAGEMRHCFHAGITLKDTDLGALMDYYTRKIRELPHAPNTNCQCNDCEYYRRDKAMMRRLLDTDANLIVRVPIMNDVLEAFSVRTDGISKADLADELSGVVSWKLRTNKGSAQRKILDNVHSLEDAIEFAKLCCRCFLVDSLWNIEYGGKRWATIANTLLQYLQGEINPASFVDRVFDLQHNCGHVFDKHPSMHLTETSYRQLNDLLDMKSQATGIDELLSYCLQKNLLTSHDSIDPEVGDLLTEWQNK